MSLQYKLKKLRVRLRRTKPKDLDLSDVQQKGYDIIIHMINDSNSQLITDTKEGRRGIKNDDVFAKIERNRMSIINGVYFYHIPIDDRIHSHIVEKFDDKMNRKFNAIDNQMRANIKDSLDIIKEGMSESKENNQ